MLNDDQDKSVKESPEQLAKPAICFALPIIDSVPGEAIMNLLLLAVETAKHCRSIIFATPLNTIPHDRARMSATKMAIDGNCEYIFWVDDDTICPRDSFEHLYKTLKEHNAVAVSGFYYRRGYPYTPVWSVPSPDGNGALQVHAPDGIHEITWSGLGCCVVDLGWVKKNLEPPYYTMQMEDNKTCTNVTDDVSFFNKVKEKGGKVLGNANVRCAHLGERMVVVDATVDFLRKVYLDATKPPTGNLPSGEKES